MINDWLSSLSILIQNSGNFALFFAFLAGVLTSFTPCSLSSVPLVIGYVGGVGVTDSKRSFYLSLVFAFGSIVTFTILGVMASLLGQSLSQVSSFWYIFLGVLMVMMALQTFEVFNFIPSTYLLSKNRKKGYLGAFLSGILGGIFSSPCATPVLIVLLAIVASSGEIVKGITMLISYSIGHSVLVIISGTSFGFARKIATSEKYGKLSEVLKIITGCIILSIGFYMFYLGF